MVLDNLKNWIKRYNNKIISAVIFLGVFIGLSLGFKVADRSYKAYNFYFNEGIAGRLLSMLPLILITLVIYLKLIPKIIDSLALLYWFLFLMLSIIPVIIVYIFNGLAQSKGVVVFIYLIVLLWFIGMFIVSKANIKIPQIKISKKVFWIFIFTFLGIGNLYLLHALGLPKNFITAFTKVYEVRLNYRSRTTRFADYFIQWMGNIIYPFLFAYTLKEKKYKKSAVVFILELVLYSYTAYKSMLVTFFLAPIFGYVLANNIKKVFIEGGILGIITVGTFLGFKGVLTVYVLAIVRIFLWPGLIALEYFDFFFMYPKAHLAHSSFVPFVKNYYSVEPSFLLARLYYNKPEMRLNTTWYADAYMNFGYIGLIIFALILFFILLIIKNSEKKNLFLVSSILFGGVISLFNGPLLTTLLTNGLALGLFIAYILPEDLCNNKENKIYIHEQFKKRLEQSKLKLKMNETNKH